VSEPPTAVVIGATGFLGSGLLRALQRDGEVPVRCLVRSAAALSSAGRVTVVHGSLEDFPVALIPSSPYVLYHLATRQHDPGRLGFVEENLRNVRRLGENITSRCRGVIYVSSLSVLGPGRQTGVDESAPVRPATELAVARAEVEKYLLDLGGRIDASVFCVRTRFVLGRGDSRTLPGLHRFMCTGLIPSTGRQCFSAIDVDDLGEVLLQLGARCQAR
jgi:nucleoside-diphosphate-sugar epimerase